jgi:hypothetical protein
MSAIYPIYIDTVQRIAVVSPTISNPVQLAPLSMGESPTLNLFFLYPKNDGSKTYNVLDYSSGYSFAAALCANVTPTPGVPAGNTTPIIGASCVVFSNISSPFIGVSGVLPLTDPSIGTMIGVTLEVQVTATIDGLPVKVLDIGLQIKASVIRGQTSSTPPQTPMPQWNPVTQRYEFYGPNGVLLGTIPPS